MKSLLKLVILLWLVALVALPGFALAMSTSGMTALGLAYDEQRQPTIPYDAPSLSAVGYDAASALVATEKANPRWGTWHLFAKFAEFLAAKGGVRFGQQGISATFRNGEFAGQAIEDVAAGLRSGAISPSQLPLQTITRDGITYTLNNRSLMALRQAGMEPTVLKDVTGNAFFEKQLTERLAEMGGHPPADFVPVIRPRKP